MARLKIEKTRNHGTMTESAFFSMIRSSLRQTSRWWKPLAESKKLVKRACKNRGLQKFEYQCAICKDYFSEKEIAVDHVIEVGSLKCKEDLPGFIERLFCEVEGLQVLCNKRKDGKESCHYKKTQQFMKS